MRMAVIVAMALVLADGAQARDEYVNPTFCYRVVHPETATHVLVDPDGSGIAMDAGGLCKGQPCARLQISAAYLWDAGHAPRAYAFHLQQGWTLATRASKRVADTQWTEYLMSRGDVLRDIYERVDRRDQARYVVMAEYRRGSKVVGQRVVGDLLASWRWLSDCL